MDARAKIGMAVAGSAIAHLMVVGGAVGWIAFGSIPDNDDFSLRTKLGSEADVEATGSNYAASREKDEPLHGGSTDQSGSVWWSWHASQDVEDVLVEVELNGADPLVGVYTGFSVSELETVAFSSSGTLNFSAKSGTDYHIAVAGSERDAEGVIKVHLRCYPKDEKQESQPEEEEIPLLLPEIVVEEKPDLLDYVRTTQNERATAAPEDYVFQSDRNTVAASELPAEEEGTENLPSQDGEEIPYLEMADREDVDGEISEDATIAIAAVEVMEPMFEETEEVLVEPLKETETPLIAEIASTDLTDKGDFATELAGDPNPDGVEELSEEQPIEELEEIEEKPEEVAETEPTEEPMENQPPQEKADPKVATVATPGDEKAKEENVFQPHTRKNKIAGTISNRGDSAVDAAETPLGRYTRLVTGAVGRRWHSERRLKSDRVTFGSLKVSFSVAPSGKPGSLRILENNADALMVDFTLGAILTAEIPPIPEEVRKVLGGEPFEITYDVIIY